MKDWVGSRSNLTSEGEPRFTRAVFDQSTGTVTLTHTNSYARLVKGYGLETLSARLQAIMRGVAGATEAFSSPAIKRIDVVSSDGKPMISTTPEAFASVNPGPSDQQPAEVDPSTAGSGTGQSGTLAQRNAVAKAESYLRYTSFSRKGLISQLEFEGFEKKVAEYAVGHIEVDWMDQAAKKARQYLDTTSFSRSGLIDQLVFEGFTREQAQHGAEAVGY